MPFLIRCVINKIQTGYFYRYITYEHGITYYMLPNDWAAKRESNKEFALSCLERVDEYKKRVDAAVAEREEQIKNEALQRIELLESKKATCEKKLETLGFFQLLREKERQGRDR